MGASAVALGRDRTVPAVSPRRPLPPPAGASHADGRTWAATRHSVTVEVAILLLGYAVYDGSRGLVGTGRSVALRHARDVVGWERDLGVGVERRFYDVAQHLHLMGVFDAGYMSLHLSVTAAVLGGLWWSRPQLFPRVRTALLVASGLALVVFVAFPTAPPRMAGIGIPDMLRSAHGGLESGALSDLYNPYAAMPSLHLAYASLVGAAIVVASRRRWVRAVGVAYPVFVAAEVVATGNHFVLDLVGGGAAAGIGWAVAGRLARPATGPDPVTGGWRGGR